MSFIKMYLDNQNLLNADFDLYIDGENKKMHLLDLDKGSRSLTNAACTNLFLQIGAVTFNFYHISINYEEYDIYLYGSDGLISEYLPDSLGGDFRHVHPSDPHLYGPFVKRCALRWDANYKKLIGQ
jgi:hypothetical protein